MGKFVKKFLIIFFLFSIVYILAILFVGSCFGTVQKNLKYIPNKSWTSRTFEDIKNYKNIDILFIGSSHCYRGYDVRIFKKNGYSSFNLGTTSQTPIQSLYLLEKYLYKLNPKLVIIDVYFELFESDGIEASIDIISNENDIKYAYKLLLKNFNPIVFNTFIYSFYDKYLKNSIFKNKKNRLKNYSNKFDNYLYGGFVERKSGFYNSSEKFVYRKINFNKKQQKYFERIIKIFKDKKIPYIIINSPITKLRYQSYSNASELDEYFKKLGPYYNFNEIPIGLMDNIHFYDSHHMNKYGVSIYNGYVLSIIKNQLKN